MPPETELQPCIVSAIEKIDNFIFEATGKRASQKEIAKALTRYFVLKEILDFITMEREETSPGSGENL